MEEIAFLIFLVVGLVITAKWWAPIVSDRAEDIDKLMLERKLKRQPELKDLSDRIDKIIKEQDGQVYTLSEISEKLNPKDKT